MSGFVYAIECAGRIKIGFSEDPDKRFSKVASDAPFPCQMLGYWHATVADELDIQTKFQSIRVHGEWFAATEDLLAFVRQTMVPPAEKVRKRLAVNDSDSPLTVWRKRSGLTQQDVAKTLGVNTSFVSQLESGYSSASIEIALKIREMSEGVVPLESLVRNRSRTEAAE